MKIALTVFDLAGTTVKDNQDVHRVLQRAMENFDVSISLEDANEVMGIPKPVAIRTLLFKYGFSKTSDKLIDEIHSAFVKEMIYFYQNDSSVGESDGVAETFSLLRAMNIKIAVDTGFDRAITSALLERLGWLKNGLVDFSVTSDEVKRGRPFPDMVFRAMELANVQDVSQVAKVGDTPYDLQEGTAANCGLVVGITTGAFTREALQVEPHSHLIDHISEIVNLVSVH
jgi:phosphonatase-like hydrolase